MGPKILIAHAKGEESLVEILAAPLRKAGYDVAHEGTVLVGDSVVGEVSRALEQGSPVVLCGTERAVGNKFVRTVANAARRINRGRLFIVQMEEGADIESLSFGEKSAIFWRDQEQALSELLASIQYYYPLEEKAQARQKALGVEERYRALLLETCDIVNLANLPEQDRHITQKQQELRLRGLFIPLRAHLEIGADVTDSSAVDTLLKSLEHQRLLRFGSWVRTNAGTERQRVSIGERLTIAKRLVILGDPGAGKTTLMRWIATAYLLRLKRDEQWKQLPDVATLPDADLLPIIVRCRDLQAQTLAGSLDDMLRFTFRRSEMSEAESGWLAESLRARLAEGTALLMLDGLDEITDPAARTRFSQQVEQIVIAYPSAPVIATSRIVGYREMGYRIGRGFEHLVLADLSPEDQNDFARRWCFLTELPERQQSAYEELVRDIHSSERIERLTANPMLLTTMALVKRKLGKLPNRRADLYWEAVQVLLNWRREIDEAMDPREALPQLEYLAYAMCDAGVQRIRRDEILSHFERAREEYPNVHALRSRTAHEFLTRVEARTGILVEAGQVRELGMLEPVYEFRHLTFQEYLAARALIDNKYPGRDPNRTLGEHVAVLAGRTGEQTVEGVKELAVVENWRETLRLAVDMCSDDIVDSVLLGLVTPQEQEGPAVARARAALAVLCLADEPNVSDETVSQIVKAFVQNVSADDSPGPETSFQTGMIQIKNTRWMENFRRSLLGKFLNLDTDEELAAGMLVGRLVGWSAIPDESEMQAWSKSQEELLRGSDEFDAISAALGICWNMMMLYEIGEARKLPPQIFAALIDNCAGTDGRAVSSAIGFVAIHYAAGFPNMDDETSAWRPTPAQMEVIIEQLGKRDSGTTKIEALLSVAQYLGDVRALDAVMPWLGNANASLRSGAASALVGIGTPESLRPVAALTADSDAEVRQNALEASARLADIEKAGLPLLTKWFDGRQPFIDPAQPITSERARTAAEKLAWPLDNVRGWYEYFASCLPIQLEWREQASAARASGSDSQGPEDRYPQP